MVDKKHLTIRIDPSDNAPRIIVAGTDIEISGILGVDIDYDATKETPWLECEVRVLAFTGAMLEAVKPVLKDRT